MAKLWLKTGAVVSIGALAVLGLTVMQPKKHHAPDIKLHAYAKDDSVPCIVTRVVDGDTFHALVFDSVPIVVRLACIDAPEKKQQFGEYSRIQLARLLGGRRIMLFKPYNTLDKYQRYICNVYSDSGFVNLEMVRRGMAFVYYDYCNNDQFALAEQEAYLNNLGVHSLTMLKPWEYRHQN